MKKTNSTNHTRTNLQLPRPNMEQQDVWGSAPTAHILAEANSILNRHKAMYLID
ncbi:MAG: hypothetical protein L3K25_07795 [Gammaproteobacteria bacterium]|nr:hypothetical protein [Gammaproteobacteria bacterium]